MSATKSKPRRRSAPLLPEVRFRTLDPGSVEVRSNAKTDELIITGAPVVYGVPYPVLDMFGEFEERISPGAARGLVAAGVDTRFLFNHDGLPLARTVAGTMSLADTPSALTFRAVLDARQQLANDLAIAIERGDVSQMSVGFIVGRDRWIDDEHREIDVFCDLLDVSAVTYPASPTTSIEVAHRMALAAPIESRARLRRMLSGATAGRPLTREQRSALQALVSAEAGTPRPSKTTAKRSGSDVVEEVRAQIAEQQAAREAARLSEDRKKLAARLSPRSRLQAQRMGIRL